MSCKRGWRVRDCELEGHCECWYDGDSCCDCGCWGDDYSSDYDDLIWDSDDDDGSDENKDDE